MCTTLRREHDFWKLSFAILGPFGSSGASFGLSIAMLGLLLKLAWTIIQWKPIWAIVGQLVIQGLFGSLRGRFLAGPGGQNAYGAGARPRF